MTNGENKISPFSAFVGFLKDNSGTIIKILIHQLGLTVFGFLLYSASASSESKPLILGLSIFSTVFYLVLLYVMFWDNGAKDKIRIDGGRMKRDCFKGAKISLIASVPNLILCLLSVIGYFCINKSLLDAAGNYVSPEWAINMHGIAQIIGIFLNSMYTGIGDVTGLDINPFYILIVSIPTVIVCGLGYFLGTHERLGVFTSAPKQTKK